MSRTIEITIGPSGELKIAAVGFVGASCEKATAFLEEALGTPMVRRREPEYYRQTRVRKVQKVGA